MRSAGRSLYVWVLVGILAGAVLGACLPDAGIACKPLGDAFIRLVRMIVTPVVFFSVVLGVTQMRDLRGVGRVGLKSLLYFEVMSTLALAVGLVVVNVIGPGHGFHVDPSTLDAGAVGKYAEASKHLSLVDFLLQIIPDTFWSALTSGQLLQVLLVALLTGFSLLLVGEHAEPLYPILESLSRVSFRVVNLVMWAAPVGAFGSMAFTVGKFGFASLRPLASLMGSFYLTCFLFVFVVLGVVARLSGFSLWRLVVYLRTELLMVLGTSSSESALAPLMEKLQHLGCRKGTVGLVVTTGYSFNLDGICIYLTMAAVFLAQALDVDLSLRDQFVFLAAAMLTSKGAAAVTGGGFVALAATLAVVPAVPVSALALILGVDRFMSEARALTNLVGNAVATVVVSRSEGEVSSADVQRVLRSPLEG
jgi:aerobic C4-dicarboxylate transport protein